jgi:hypothetical protein
MGKKLCALMTSLQMAKRCLQKAVTFYLLLPLLSEHISKLYFSITYV